MGGVRIERAKLPAGDPLLENLAHGAEEAEEALLYLVLQMAGARPSARA